MLLLLKWLKNTEIIKTSHAQIFLFFSIMERIRKGSDLPKKVGVTKHPTKIFAHQVNAKVVSSIFVEFSTRLKLHDVACACPINSVRTRDAQ